MEAGHYPQTHGQLAALAQRNTVSARGFFWVGPLPDLADAQQLAEDLALARDYNVHRCRTCFGGT